MFLIFVFLPVQALASEIHGYGNTIAEYGGEAHYSCSAANPAAGVLQVTWQRVGSDGPIENLATYTKRFGQQINAPYRGKVVFTEASLNSTSISLSNISWQDESCYICSFHMYPMGSKGQQTCLSVQGISSVDTASVAREAWGEDGVKVEFSCSATGKPAPTIEWDISPGAAHVDPSQIEMVTNADHTFTSSHNVTLGVPGSWRGHVDCVLNRGQRGHRRERIPFTVGHEHLETKNDETLPTLALTVIITGLCISFVIAIVVFISMRKRLMGRGRNQTLEKRQQKTASVLLHQLLHI